MWENNDKIGINWRKILDNFDKLLFFSFALIVYLIIVFFSTYIKYIGKFNRIFDVQRPSHASSSQSKENILLIFV